MKKDKQIGKLPKAPLQEVIFEVRWDLEFIADLNQNTDPGFKRAYGVLSSLVKKEFPIEKNKFAVDIPSFITNYQPVYQFWKADKTWPVLQLGPGVFTVNETDKNYEWKNYFFPLIKKGLNYLFKAYDKELPLQYASLRYIDVIKINDYNFKDWKGFIEENLNFSFENIFDTRGHLKKFNFNQIFELIDGSELQFAIFNSKNISQEDILLWETNIKKTGSFTTESLIEWLLQAHNTTSELFKEVCKEGLYERFK